MKRLLRNVILISILSMLWGMTAFAEEDVVLLDTEEGSIQTEFLDFPESVVRGEVYTGTIRITNNRSKEYRVYVVNDSLGKNEFLNVIYDFGLLYERADGYGMNMEPVSIAPGEFADIHVKYIVPPFVKGDTADLALKTYCLKSEEEGGFVDQTYTQSYQAALSGDMRIVSIDAMSIIPENDGRYKISIDRYNMNGYEEPDFSFHYRKAGETGGESWIWIGDKDNIEDVYYNENYVYWTPQENRAYEFAAIIDYRYYKDDFAIENVAAETLRFVPGMSFTDTKPGDWYYDAASYVYEKGIMMGMNEKEFGPSVKLSRAQFATILYRMEGEPEVAYDPSTFPDVADGQFYTAAAMWAKNTGVISGYEDGRFGPADEITREQMAVMMYRYANMCGLDTSVEGDMSVFPDAGRVSPFADKEVKWTVGEGLIKGDGGNVNPQGTAERAQCATIIMRFMEGYGL